VVDSMVVARAWQLLEGWLFNEPSFRFLGSPAQPSLRPCSRRHQNQLQGWNLWRGAGEKDRCRRPSEAQSQRTDPSESESLSTGQQCIDTKPPKKWKRIFWRSRAKAARKGLDLSCPDLAVRDQDRRWNRAKGALPCIEDELFPLIGVPMIHPRITSRMSPRMLWRLEPEWEQDKGRTDHLDVAACRYFKVA